jgi:hypothetical protein
MAFPEYNALLAVHKVGIAIPNLEQTTLISHIQMLINDPEQYQQFQAACRVASQAWTWEQEVTKLHAFYQHVFQNDSL